MTCGHQPDQCWQYWPVITLCGSMRFYKQMLTVAADLTLKNHVVLMPFCVVEEAQQDGEDKEMLDALHRRKIDMSWKVVVVSDTNLYVGESTKAEVQYAKKRSNVLYIDRAIVGGKPEGKSRAIFYRNWTPDIDEKDW